PCGDLRRQDVVHAARRLNLLLSHWISLFVIADLGVCGLTEPSASITNVVASRPARRGIKTSLPSTCISTAEANPNVTRSGGTPLIVRTLPGKPVANISCRPDAS